MNKIKTQILSATDTGLVREANEDSCGTAETPNGILCVVCDGMGGHVGGAEASRIAVNCIIQYFDREIYPDIKQALKETLDFANLQIIGAASENPDLQGMGTTACVLLVQDNCVWLAHVGDSRISVGARINLKTVQIGNKIIENVEATIIENPRAECLLGQTVLSRFGQYTIDNVNNEIIFK